MTYVITFMLFSVNSIEMSSFSWWVWPNNVTFFLINYQDDNEKLST